MAGASSFEHLVSWATGKAFEKLDPGELLPKTMDKHLDNIFSKHAWRGFDSALGARRFLTEVASDQTGKMVASFVRPEDQDEPVDLIQVEHGDCIDATLLVYVEVPWKNNPIQSVMFSPAVVANAPPIQVIPVAPVALAPPVATPIPVTPQKPAAQQNVTIPPNARERPSSSSSLTSSSSDHSSRSSGNCGEWNSCRQAIQASSSPSIAGRMFDGGRR